MKSGFPGLFFVYIRKFPDASKPFYQYNLQHLLNTSFEHNRCASLPQITFQLRSKTYLNYSLNDVEFAIKFLNPNSCKRSKPQNSFEKVDN